MADKFEDLRTFVTVMSCGGINAAAAEMGIAKSAVSRRISDLEARLGVTLIERSTRKFDVTAVGREYLRRASELLAALERLDADPAGTNDSEAVSVSAPHDILAHLIAPVLPAFVPRHAGLTLRLLGEGETADLIISTSVPAGGETRAIATSRLVLCASPAYLADRGMPTTVADLATQSGIAIGAGQPWTFAGGGTRRPLDLVHAPDVEVAISLAAAGLGIAQVPGYAARTALLDGHVVTVLDGHEPPSREVLARHDEGATSMVRALADHLARSIPQIG